MQQTLYTNASLTPSPYWAQEAQTSTTILPNRILSVACYVHFSLKTKTRILHFILSTHQLLSPPTGLFPDN